MVHIFMPFIEALRVCCGCLSSFLPKTLAQGLLLFPVKDGVLFKKLKMPDVKKEFDSLAKDIQKQFKARKVMPKDVDEAVKWARKR